MQSGKNQKNIMKKKEKKKMSKTPILVLSAGHGYNTPGKRCLKKIDPNQTREWWLNDRIADMVQFDLESGYKCIILRADDTTGAKDISLANRVKLANNANADFYMSIHHNAGIKGGTGGGTVVFYWSSIKMRDMAQRLYNFVTDETKLYGNRSEQVIKKNFYVIANTKMPALLIENGFMDSQTDVPIILSYEHARKTADGIVAYLVKECKIEPKKKPATVTKPVVDTYTVHSGDTLSDIGKKLNLNWREIAELNNISGPKYIIRKGQVLNLPGNVKAESVYYPAYKGGKTTLSNALKALGIDNSFAFRKQIAKANNITLYAGTAAQNTQMYNLLVAGLLKKA